MHAMEHMPPGLTPEQRQEWAKASHDAWADFQKRQQQEADDEFQGPHSPRNSLVSRIIVWV